MGFVWFRTLIARQGSATDNQAERFKISDINIYLNELIYQFRCNHKTQWHGERTIYRGTKASNRERVSFFRPYHISVFIVSAPTQAAYLHNKMICNLVWLHQNEILYPQISNIAEPRSHLKRKVFLVRLFSLFLLCIFTRNFTWAASGQMWHLLPRT